MHGPDKAHLVAWSAADVPLEAPGRAHFDVVALLVAKEGHPAARCTTGGKLDQLRTLKLGGEQLLLVISNQVTGESREFAKVIEILE